MTDIGVPQYTQSRESLGSSEGQGIADAGVAIAGAAKAIQGQIAENKAEDLRSNLQNLGDGALASTEGNEMAPQFEIRPELNAEEERLYNDIRDLTRSAEQQTGARRTAVINRAKQLTQQAMNNTRNPQTRARLATEFNQFVSYNPALDVLGMQDSQSSLSADLAQQQVQLMFDKSYESVEDGGHGIDTRIVFGSDEWVKEFAYRERRDAQAGAELFAIQQFDAAEQLDLRKQLPAINNALSESHTAVDTIVREDLAYAERIAGAMQRIANDAATDGDAAMVNEWTISGKERMQSRLLAQQAELEIIKVRIEGAANLDAYGQGVIKRIDAAQAYIDKWISIAENMGDKPDIIKLGEYEKAVRKRQFRVKNPETEELIMYLEEIAPVLENAVTFDLEDSLLADDIGQYAITSITDTLATNDVFGDAWQRHAGTPGQVLDRANQERATANDVYEAGSDTPEGRAKAALTQIMSSHAQRPNFDVVLRDKNIPLTSHFFNTYMGEASQLEELRMGQAFQPATMEQVEKLYGSDQFLDQTMEARSRKMSSQENMSVQALGESLFRYNADSDIVRRKGRSGNRLNTTFGPVQLRDAVTFDFSGLDQGEIRVNVKPDAGKQAAAVPESARPLVETGYYIGSSPVIEQQKIEAEALKLQEDINRYLRYEANIQMMRGNAQRPNYALTWDENRYNEIYTSRPRGE